MLCAGHRCIRVETASISTHCLVTNRILCFWPVQQSMKQLPRRRRKKKNNEFFGKMALLEVSLSLLAPAEPCRKERALPGAGLERARSDSAASSSEPVCE